MPARYDQHFLVSPGVAERILSAVDAREGERILEIGPGRGMLTRGLLRSGAVLTAVEIDARLGERLRGDFPTLDLRSADFLEVDLAALPAPRKVVSNLPYSVAAPILQRLLFWPVWESAVLMFQKEVAERILAGPGSRKYGLLGLSVWPGADVERVCAVVKGCFSPPPKVDSCVLRLRRVAVSRLPEGLGSDEFLETAKAAFSQRRKRAATAIADALDLPRPEVEIAMERAGLDIRSRAEQIAPEGFAGLAIALRVYRPNHACGEKAGRHAGGGGGASAPAAGSSCAGPA